MCQSYTFCATPEIFGVTLFIIQFMISPKNVGLAQNILGSIEGQKEFFFRLDNKSKFCNDRSEMQLNKFSL